MSSSTLFVGARVYDGRRLHATLLLDEGEVVFAGPEGEARRLAPTGTEVRALDGGLLIPGLIDAHLHVAELTRTREGLDVRDVASVGALQDRLREWAGAHPDGPIIARGWDPEKFPGRTWLTREDLDRVGLDRPVALVHVSGHALVASSAALAAAGVGPATPDPPGGKFGRAPDGTPDGRAFERAAAYLKQRIPGAERIDPEALRRTLVFAAALGITTVGAMSASPEEAVGLRQVAEAGELPGRVRVYLRGDRWSEYFRDPGGPSGPPDRFEVVGVKAFTDGAFGPRTAWLDAPYADDPSTSGMAAATDEELRGLLDAAAAQRLQPALHAIGDRAVRHALELLDGFPDLGKPVRIEHAALTPPSLFSALSDVRPALVVQPGFVWSDSWLASRLGAERARWAYAFRTLLALGQLLVGSSDAPYDPFNPWRGLQAAVARTDPDGSSANPIHDEALAPEEAFPMYGGNAGRMFGEPTLGTLEPGAPADLLWVRAPTLASAIADGEAGVRGVWVDGRPIVAPPPSTGTG